MVIHFTETRGLWQHLVAANLAFNELAALSFVSHGKASATATTLNSANCNK